MGEKWKWINPQSTPNYDEDDHTPTTTTLTITVTREEFENKSTLTDTFHAS